MVFTVTSVPEVLTAMAEGDADVGVLVAVVVMLAGVETRLVWTKLKRPPKPAPELSFT